MEAAGQHTHRNTVAAGTTPKDPRVPVGEIEREIAAIWAEVLRLQHVARDQNFFELGGDSQSTLETLLKINESLGTELTIADVYGSPTIRDLARRIEEGPLKDRPVDLCTEAVLPNEILPLAGPVGATQRILLTGGTGFVGRFLLTRLLRETDARLYCLVRACTEADAQARLQEALVRWNLWDPGDRDRIVALAGDLRRPRLGLTEDVYCTLAEQTDVIYHCATSMNHLESYAMARAANVDAARDVLRLATLGRRKAVHYVSTLGIFDAANAGVERVVDEGTSIDFERHFQSGGYLASKWVAEKLFFTAITRGIPCNIFRLGLIWADSVEGRYDERQYEYRLLKSCLLSGCGIRGYRYVLPLTPVDYAAQAMSFLARAYPEGGGVFHISSGGPEVGEVFERLNDSGATGLKLLPFYEWTQEIKRLHLAGRTLPIVPVMEFAFSLEEHSFYDHPRVRAWHTRFDSSHTRRELERAGIVSPQETVDLPAQCMAAMRLWDADLKH